MTKLEAALQALEASGVKMWRSDCEYPTDTNAPRDGLQVIELQWACERESPPCLVIRQNEQTIMLTHPLLLAIFRFIGKWDTEEAAAPAVETLEKVS